MTQTIIIKTQSLYSCITLNYTYRIQLELTDREMYLKRRHHFHYKKGRIGYIITQTIPSLIQFLADSPKYSMCAEDQDSLKHIQFSYVHPIWARYNLKTEVFNIEDVLKSKKYWALIAVTYNEYWGQTQRGNNCSYGNYQLLL